jgi:hypothetical protein
MGFHQLLYPPGSDAQQVAGGNDRDQCGLGDAGRLRNGNDDDVRVVRRGRPLPLVRRGAAAPRTCWARFNRMSRSVLVLSTLYQPAVGGARTYARILVEGRPARGHDVLLVTDHFRGSYQAGHVVELGRYLERLKRSPRSL